MGSGGWGMAEDVRDTMAEDAAELAELRRRISALNHTLLERLNERARLVQKVRAIKARHAMDMFTPSREQEMLDSLVAENPGPFGDDTIRHLFGEIFRASVGLMEQASGQKLVVGRKPGIEEVVVRVGGRELGREPVVIAGPCAVETEEQMERVARSLAALGIGFMRGGAFKPRSSPYAFQGLGEAGLLLLEQAARRHGLVSVTEVVDTRDVELVARHADILQIGSRNMASYELLKAAARTGKPVLLKRGFAATLDELLHAAEYMAVSGNEQIVLCERGIRTFGSETRFTLDISAVPLLRGMCRLPVIVDVSHAAGRRDILLPLARAALAAGAQGVMLEVHPTPAVARSDSHQQLDLEQFAELHAALAPWLPAGPRSEQQSADARRQPGSEEACRPAAG